VQTKYLWSKPFCVWNDLEFIDARRVSRSEHSLSVLTLNLYMSKKFEPPIWCNHIWCNHIWCSRIWYLGNSFIFDARSFSSSFFWYPQIFLVPRDFFATPRFFCYPQIFLLPPVFFGTPRFFWYLQFFLESQFL